METSEPEAKKPKQNSTNKENKKRKNNTTDSDVNKKRKVSATVNGDATPKQLNAQKKQKVAKDSNSILNKLDSVKRIENGKTKDNTSQSGQKKENVSRNGQKKDTLSQNGEKKDNLSQNGQNKESVSKNGQKKESVSHGQKKDKTSHSGQQKVIKENGVKHDKSKISVKLLDSKADNSDKDKYNKKTINNNDKVILKGKNKKPESPSSPKNKNPTLLVNKVKQFQKKTEFQKLQKKVEKKTESNNFDTPKKVKFVLKNNSMQQPVDYYKSVRQSPSIPFDSAKKPSKTNLKPSTPSPINPFFKKKLRLKQ